MNKGKDIWERASINETEWRFEMSALKINHVQPWIRVFSPFSNFLSLVTKHQKIVLMPVCDVPEIQQNSSCLYNCCSALSLRHTFKTFHCSFLKAFILLVHKEEWREAISLLSLLRNRIEFLVLSALFSSDISGSFQLREAAVILVSYEPYFVGPICPQKRFI